MCPLSFFKLLFLESNSKFEKYLTLIREAKKNYIPCNQTKCSCHAEVITNDLKIFNKGISKKLLQDVKSK